MKRLAARDWLLLVFAFRLITNCSSESKHTNATDICQTDVDCKIRPATCDGLDVVDYVAGCVRGACVWHETRTACVGRCLDATCQPDELPIGLRMTADDCSGLPPPSTCADPETVAYWAPDCVALRCQWMVEGQC